MVGLKPTNKTLHRKVFKSMNRYDSLAEKAYAVGDMKKGMAYEKKSDTLYAKNYGKMFGLRKVNGRWVKVKK